MIVSGFIYGVIKLFFLRFEAGDIYPAYSSLRSDPLGSRAWYRSLKNINGAAVSRNYLPLQNVVFRGNTTLFYIGAPIFDSDSVSREWFKVFERFTDSGGRLVLSFLPVEKKPSGRRLSKCFRPEEKGEPLQRAAPEGSENPTKPHTAENTSNSQSASNNDDKGPESGIGPLNAEKQSTCVSMNEEWGLAFAFAEKLPDKASIAGGYPSRPLFKGLPQTISWHTALYFDGFDNNWQVIYTAGGRPVIVERPYGNGSLVLVADSFFMSNEALKSERHAGLLAWTLGDSSSIVFDETHFGIFRHPGVLSLIKKYRFHWFIFALAVLALLFIWKNSAYFVPPPQKSRPQTIRDFTSDRDSTQGLISLLRRNIPPRQLLQTCTREWERAVQPEKRLPEEKLAQINSTFQTIFAHIPKSGNLVNGYRRISKIISKGKYDE